MVQQIVITLFVNDLFGKSLQHVNSGMLTNSYFIRLSMARGIQHRSRRSHTASMRRCSSVWLTIGFFYLSFQAALYFIGFVFYLPKEFLLRQQCWTAQYVLKNALDRQIRETK